MEGVKGSTSNTQVQVVGGGEGARREIEGQEEQKKKKDLKSLTILLTMKHATPPKKGDLVDDETCHTTKKRQHIKNKEHHDEPHFCQGKKWAQLDKWLY
jgi:hypothetical protein